MCYGLPYEFRFIYLFYFFFNSITRDTAVFLPYYFLLGTYQARVQVLFSSRLAQNPYTFHKQFGPTDITPQGLTNPDRLNQTSLIQNKNGIPIRCKFSPQSETDGTKPDKNSLDEKKSHHTGLVPKDRLGEIFARLGFAV